MTVMTSSVSVELSPLMFKLSTVKFTPIVLWTKGLGVNEGVSLGPDDGLLLNEGVSLGADDGLLLKEGVTLGADDGFKEGI